VSSGIQMASHKLCAALHEDGINPYEVEISLPKEAWWRMWTRLEQLERGLMTFDGRGPISQSFQYMGIKYSIKNDR
jgi:hypothetical protein